MAELEKKEGQDASWVRVNGEETLLHITDESVMFEKGGNVRGFERSAIRMIKPDGDAMVIAYAAGNEVKSIRVEPLTAVASLIVPEHASGATNHGTRSYSALDEVFEKLYRETRSDLEERLAKVQKEPENKSLRLTQSEEMRYEESSRQMAGLAGAKHGFDPRAEDNPISFWGLEKQQYELQLDVVKILHIYYLRGLAGPKAETEDIGYSAYEVWPDDWERILVKFKLNDQPFLTQKFKSYLRSHWKYTPGERKPVLAGA